MRNEEHRFGSEVFLLLREGTQHSRTHGFRWSCFALWFPWGVMGEVVFSNDSVGLRAEKLARP